MAASEHGFADGHEVGDGVVAIADELGGLVDAFMGGTFRHTSCRFDEINAYIILDHSHRRPKPRYIP